MGNDALIHASALVAPSAHIGARTRVWHIAQIRDHAVIGDDCILGKNVFIDEKVRIGDCVKMQNNVSLYNGVTIEDGVFIGPHVCFTNDKLPRAVTPDGRLKSSDDWEMGRTLVRKGAALGAGSVIVAGITIGRWAMVGAGAVVTRDVPDYGLAAGNPARLRGAVCACGHRLLDGEATLSCRKCGATYRREAAGQIVPMKPGSRRIRRHE
jgi:acetyltransferase-like isoleucine patch superfamily enzyme